MFKDMRKIASAILIMLISFSFCSVAYSADEKMDPYNTELNFYTGMFDFSDHKQRSALIGIEHQNDELFIKGQHGRYSPITGAFWTEKNAFYLYTGIQAEYEFGSFVISPSFSPGYYNEGGGKDLGSPVEFKTEVQLSYDWNESTHLGMSYNHISNAHINPDSNPGANSYMFNFLKSF